MNRPLLALALGTAALSVISVASDDVPKTDKKQAETSLSKHEDQVGGLQKQQAVDRKQIRAEIAKIKATLKKLKSTKCPDKPGTGGGSDTNKPVEELPIPDGAELSAQSITTVTGKRYLYIPLSSLSAGAVVSDQSLGLATAAPAFSASAVVTQPITTFATPASSTCSGAMAAQTFSAPMAQAFTPQIISAYSTPVITGYSVPYQASAYAMPYQASSYAAPHGYDSSALATNHFVNNLPNFQTLQIRGGRTFVTAPSATRPYVLSPYEASYYGVAGTQAATVFSQGVAIPPSVAPRSFIRTWR